MPNCRGTKPRSIPRAFQVYGQITASQALVDDAELLVSTVHKSGDGTLVYQDVSTAVKTLTRQMFCFFWTLRAQIELSLVYNEAYYDSAFPVKVLDKMKETLRRTAKI